MISQTIPKNIYIEVFQYFSKNPYIELFVIEHNFVNVTVIHFVMSIPFLRTFHGGQK